VILGTALGVEWVRPMIGDPTGPYHIDVGVPLWITLAVPVAVLALVALAGLAAAVGAERLTAAQAIADGSASPTTDDGSQANGAVSAAACTVRERSARLTSRLARPQTTARLRLTALYGCLFPFCGAALLAITYALVDDAAITTAGGQLVPDQRIADLHDLIVKSGIALAIMGSPSMSPTTVTSPPPSSTFTRTTSSCSTATFPASTATPSASSSPAARTRR
jgi:hypothetical protein